MIHICLSFAGSLQQMRNLWYTPHAMMRLAAIAFNGTNNAIVGQCNIPRTNDDAEICNNLASWLADHPGACLWTAGNTLTQLARLYQSCDLPLPWQPEQCRSYELLAAIHNEDSALAGSPCNQALAMANHIGQLLRSKLQLRLVPPLQIIAGEHTGCAAEFIEWLKPGQTVSVGSNDWTNHLSKTYLLVRLQRGGVFIGVDAVPECAVALNHTLASQPRAAIH